MDQVIKALQVNAAQMKLDGRPDLNPYAPTSLAHHAWSRTRMTFDQFGRDAATRLAEDYDRNLNLGLAAQLRNWTK